MDCLLFVVLSLEVLEGLLGESGLMIPVVSALGDLQRLARMTVRLIHHHRPQPVPSKISAGL
jgi:hypothetical protein